VTLYAIISSGLNSIIALGLGFSFLLAKNRNRKQTAFAILCLTIATWSCSYFFWQAARNPAQALFFSRLLMVASMFIPIAYLAFVCAITDLKRPRLIAAGVGAGILLAPILFTPAGIPSVSAKGGFPHWPDAGPALSGYFAVFFGYAAYSWVLQARAIRFHPGRDGNQVKFFFIASLIGYLGGSSNFPLWYGINIPPVGNGLVSLYLLMMGYGFLEYKRAFVRTDLIKEAVNICLILAVVVFYVILVAGFSAWAGSPLSNNGLLLHFFGASGVLAAAVWIVPRLKKEAERVLEATILKEHYRHTGDVQKLIHRVGAVKQEEEMFAEVADCLHRRAGVSKVSIFARSDVGFNFPLRANAGHDSKRIKMPVLAADHWLINLGRESRKPILGDELNRWRQSHDIVEVPPGPEVIFPIHCEASFFGLLMIGPRADRQPYSDVDLSLFETLCLQIGLTLRSRQIERRLNQNDKLVSLGTFAAGLAHEIRNPLVSLRTYAELAAQGETGDDADLCRAMKRDVDRIAGIVENIASFAADRSVAARPVALKDVWAAVHEIVKNELHHAGVTVDFTDEVGLLVHANYTQMVQVFLNLTQNGIQSMESSSIKRLSVRIERWSDQATRQPFASIVFGDTGSGIKDELLPSLFDPFVTTRDTGDAPNRRGLGLGLAIVKRIVESHHGQVEVESVLGEGSTFRLLLPAFPAAGLQSSRAAAGPSAGKAALGL
jgi:signal transduction histidine kinase